MAKGSKSKTVATQTPPAYIESAYKGVLDRAADVSNRPFVPYAGEKVAPLSSEERSGIAQVSENMEYAQPYIQGAASGLTAAYNAAVPEYQKAIQQTGEAGDIGQAYGDVAGSYYATAMPAAQPYMQAAEGTVAQGSQIGSAMTGAAIAGLAGAQGYAAPYNEAAMAQATGAYQSAQPYQQTATGMTMEASGAVNPVQFSGEQMRQYMSPYMQEVYNATLANINEQNARQMSQLAGTAISRGAFGGDRAGIAAAEMRRQQNLAAQATLSNLLQKGYEGAVNQFNVQQRTNLEAEQANRAAQAAAADRLAKLGQQGFQQGMDYSGRTSAIGGQGFQQGVTTAKTASDVGASAFGQGLERGQFEKGLGTTAYEQSMGTGKAAQGLGESLSNIGMEEARQRGALAQAGYGMGEAAAKTMAGLGTTGQEAAISGGQAGIQAGGVERAVRQAQDEAAYNEFLAAQAYPFQTTQFVSDIAQGIGGQAGGTTTQTGKASNQGSTASSIVGGIGTGLDLFDKISNRARGGSVDGYAAGGSIGMIPYEMLFSGKSYIPKRVQPGRPSRMFPDAGRPPPLPEEPQYDLGALADRIAAYGRPGLDFSNLSGSNIDFETQLAADLNRDFQNTLAADLSELGYGGRVDYAYGGVPTGKIAIPLSRARNRSPSQIFPGLAAPPAAPKDDGNLGDALGKISETIGRLNQQDSGANQGLNPTLEPKPTTLEGPGTLQGQSDRQSGSFISGDEFTLDNPRGGLRMPFAEGGMPNAMISIPQRAPMRARDIFPDINQGQQPTQGGGTTGKIVDVAMKIVPMFFGAPPMNTGGRTHYDIGGKTEDDPLTKPEMAKSVEGLAKIKTPDAVVDVPNQPPSKPGKIFPEIQPVQQGGGGGGLFGKIFSGIKKAASLGTMAEGGRIGYEYGGAPDEELLSMIARFETGGEEDPYSATNPESTATGKYQFLRDTWGGLQKNYPDADLPPFQSMKGDAEAQERAGRLLLNENRKAAQDKGVEFTPEVALQMHQMGAPEFFAMRTRQGRVPEDRQPGLVAATPEPVAVSSPGLASTEAAPPEPGLGSSAPPRLIEQQEPKERRNIYERILNADLSPEAELGIRAAFASMLGGQNIGRGILTGMSAYTQAQQRALEREKAEAEMEVAARRVGAEEMTAETGRRKAETEEEVRRLEVAEKIRGMYRRIVQLDGTTVYIGPNNEQLTEQQFNGLLQRLYGETLAKGAISSPLPTGGVPVPPVVPSEAVLQPGEKPAPQPYRSEAFPGVDFGEVDPKNPVAPEYTPKNINIAVADLQNRKQMAEAVGAPTAIFDENIARLLENKGKAMKGEAVTLMDGTLGRWPPGYDQRKREEYREPLAKEAETYAEQAATARSQLVPIESTVEIVANPNNQAGAYAGAISKIVKYAEPFLGDDQKGSAAENQQIFEKNIAELINQQTTALAKSGVGRVLDREVQNLTSAIPQYTNERDANLYLLAVFGTIERQKIRFNTDFAEWRKTNQTPTQEEVLAFAEDWRNKNNLKSEVERTKNEYSIDPTKILPRPQDLKNVVNGGYYRGEGHHDGNKYGYDQVYVAKKDRNNVRFFPVE